MLYQGSRPSKKSHNPPAPPALGRWLSLGGGGGGLGFSLFFFLITIENIYLWHGDCSLSVAAQVAGKEAKSIEYLYPSPASRDAISQGIGCCVKV